MHPAFSKGPFKAVGEKSPRSMLLPTCFCFLCSSWSESFWRNRTIVKTRTAILARKHFSWSVNCYVSGSPFKILFYNRSSRVLLIFYFLIRTSICQTNLSLRILGFVCTISRFHVENIFVGLVGLGQYSTTQKTNGAWKYLEYFI